MNMKDMKEMGARLANGPKAKSSVDAAAIRELAELLAETGLTEIEIETSGMKLRTDWTAKHPTATLQDFHDAFLSHGAAPLPVIRRAMLDDDDVI